MDLKRPESVLVVIYSLQGRVLMLQRQDDPEFWQSVTGTLEPGELPIQTAYREVAEETGIALSMESGLIQDCDQVNRYAIRELWLNRYPKGTKFNTEHVFCLCIDQTNQLRLTEHLSFQWLAKAEAIALAWSKTNADAIAQFVPEVL
ncbi:dihydroneopterin triphosphate diphosphatase [Glaciecola sp. 1036]|uniref:dihydroneopterin triphosphate diphosphatase n=1 Tax=Alteromonadaceae TaxID=72275 RepID=UPI003CFC239D